MYATIAEVGTRRYWGATNIGVRPTFGGTALSIETHFLENTGDHLGESMTLTFVRRIREERKFSGAEALARQISTDIAQVRELLAAAGPSIIR